jgi:hypothetical protein
MITLTTGRMIPSRTNRCFIVNLTSQSAILNVECERNRETFMRNILKLLMLNVDSYCRIVSAKIHFQISTKENRVSYKRHTSKHGSLHIIYIYTRLYTCLTPIPRFALRDKVTLRLLKLLF